MHLLNAEWDADMFSELTKDTQFFKLTYKHTFSKAKRGKETFYGHFIKAQK